MHEQPVASTSQMPVDVPSASSSTPSEPLIARNDFPEPSTSSHLDTAPEAGPSSLVPESSEPVATGGAKKVDANLKVWKPYSGMPPRIRKSVAPCRNHVS